MYFSHRTRNFCSQFIHHCIDLSANQGMNNTHQYLCRWGCNSYRTCNFGSAPRCLRSYRRSRRCSKKWCRKTRLLRRCKFHPACSLFQVCHFFSWFRPSWTAKSVWEATVGPEVGLATVAVGSSHQCHWLAEHSTFLVDSHCFSSILQKNMYIE